MGIFKNIHNAIDKWLHKEEIEAYQRMQEEGQVQTPPSQEELEEERKRLERIAEAEMDKIKGEDHSNPPSQADINRYYDYHENFVNNIKMITEHTGQSPPFDVPERPVNVNEYNDRAREEGWSYLRKSCGLPTGDLFKPSKPWTMASGDKMWRVDDWKTDNDEPEIHWKTKK